MLYKLTRKHESTICHNEKEVKLAQKKGYTLDGEVNEKYEVINANPVFDAPKAKTKKQK